MTRSKKHTIEMELSEIMMDNRIGNHFLKDMDIAIEDKPLFIYLFEGIELEDKSILLECLEMLQDRINKMCGVKDEIKGE